MSVIGKLAVDLTADTTQFKKQLNDAAEAATGFKDKVTSQLSSLGLSGLFAGFSAGVFVNELRKVVQETANAASEIERLSQLSGTTTTAFQEMAAGAAKVKIEQSELADMLKDVNEKFGEMTSTGSGPLKDFFEQIAPKVGVTADQFRRLSGPEALQLYYDSLIKAGANSKQVTFYMEQLVSNGTKLVPMLKDSGAGFKAAAAEAERLGLIMDQKAIAESKRFDEEMKALDRTFTGFKRGVGLSVIPALNDIISFAERARKEYGLLGAAIAAIGGPVLKAVGVELDPTKRAVTESKELFGQLVKNKSEIDRYKKQIDDGLGFKSVLESNIKSLEKENDEIRKKLSDRNKVVAEAAAVEGRAAQAKRLADKAAREAEMSAGVTPIAAPAKTKGSSRKEQTEEEKAYASVLKEVTDAEIEAAAATMEFFVPAQEKLFRLRKSEDWKRLTEDQQKFISSRFKEIEATQLITAAEEELKKKLEEARLETIRLADELNDKLPGPKQFSPQSAIFRLPHGPEDEIDPRVRKLHEELNAEYENIRTLNEQLKIKKELKLVEDQATAELMKTPALIAAQIEQLKKQMEILKEQGFFDGFSEKDYEKVFNNLKKKIEETGETTNSPGGQFINLSNTLDSAASKMTDAFIGFASGAKSSFADMTKSILAEIGKMILKQLIFNQLLSGAKMMASSETDWIAAIGEAFIGGPTTASANGNVFNAGKLVPFANGGAVVSQPTFFPMANGGTGLMGEAGVEGVFPLTRINGKLGIQAAGAGSSYVDQRRYEVAVTVQGSQNNEQTGQIVAEKVMRAIAQQEIVKQQRLGGSLNPMGIK